MTDEEARNILERWRERAAYRARMGYTSDASDEAAFAHALVALTDRKALMVVIADQPHPWPQSVIAARDATRRHMEGK